MTDWYKIDDPENPPPKDGTEVDLWAKIWLSEYDEFKGKRFPDAYWSEGDSMCNRPAGWERVDKGWRVTHWRSVPAPPAQEPPR